MLNVRHLPFDLGEGAGYRAAVGVVVLATERTLEREWRDLFPSDGAAFYVNRIPFSGQATRSAMLEQEQYLRSITGDDTAARTPRL